MGVREEPRIRSRTFEEMVPAGITRYDLILASIPLVFVAAVIVASVASLPMNVAVIGGAVVGAIVLSDALFLNPPTGRHRGGSGE